jgi:hypothetical protein
VPDLHKKTVSAGVIGPDLHGKRVKDVRRFGTMADALLRLADWRREHAVIHVAMESTGV